jgi:hypothetical protein
MHVLRESRVRVARLPDVTRRLHVARVCERVDGRGAAKADRVDANVQARRSSQRPCRKRVAHLPAFEPVD